MIFSINAIKIFFDNIKHESLCLAHQTKQYNKKAMYQSWLFSMASE